MAEVPSRDEVVEMLGSPDLNQAEKRDLLLAYYRYTSTGDEVLATHASELKLGDVEIVASRLWSPFASKGMLLDVHKRYKNEVEQRVNAGARAGKDKLEDLKRKGAGVANSNEILDVGLPGLEVFKRFGRVYAAAPRGCTTPGAIPGDAYAKAKERYEEQRDIRFDRLGAHAQALLDAKGSIEAAAAKSSGSLSGLYGHWTGKAADRSRVFSDRFRVETGHLTQSLHGAAEVIRSTSAKAVQLCRSKAEFALSTHKERLPDRTVAEGLTIMKMAGGRWDADVRNAARLVGGAAAKQAEDDACAVNDETRRFVEAEALKWARLFCQAFEALYANFVKMCDDTLKTVNELWKVLTDHLNQLNDNPFKELIGGTPPGGGGKPGPGGGGPIGGGGGGGPIGGGGGGGGGIPPIATPPPISTPPPITPPIPVLGGTEPSAIPGVPVPGGIQPRESVSFEDGGRKISVTSPDRDGHVTITVEGPDGKPKVYEVDFGPAGPEVKPMPQPGGIPVQPGNAPLVVPQENPVTKADENGKAAIRDGDRTILAERVPGDSGHLRVTVPGADGRPTTYDLNFKDGRVEHASASLGSHQSSSEFEEAEYRPTSSAPRPGDAGLGSMPGDGPQVPAAPQPQSAGMTGGMMAPPAGGGGGDQERSGNNWRTQGYVVDDGEATEAVSRLARVLGGLDDEENQR